MGNKTIRLRTTPGDSKNIQIKVDQDFDFLEVLSLKINQEDLYKTFCANYGVVVGRVIANKGFGLPNAKVSVFVPISSEDEQNQLITDLYPYKTSVSKNGNIRYNLLLSESTCSINTPVGTFPTKEQVIDNDIVIEIFEKYYKYTTTTNESGDYMIFGVPTGQQTVHMDVDLSDVSITSIRPYDLIDSGVPKELFDSRTEFKSSTNLGELPQIKTGNIGVDVIPFWGDEETCDIGITRVDFDTNSEIIPRSLFMGSTITDVNKESLNKTCNPRNEQGFLKNVKPSSGDIKILRVSGYDNNEWFSNKEIKAFELEDFSTEEAKIDDDGAFAFSLPMNLGHMVTNEFGDLVPSADPTIGVATKAMYRFAMSVDDSKSGRLRRTASMLFPSLGVKFGGTGGYVRGENRTGTEDQRFTNNIFEYSNVDNILDTTSYDNIDKDFHTFEWKQVYSIAQYIKKYKKGGDRFSFLGFKGVDSVESEHNPMPFTTGIWKPNISFTVLSFVQSLAYIINAALISLILLNLGFCWTIRMPAGVYNSCNCFSLRPLGWLTVIYGKIKNDNDYNQDVQDSPECGGDPECNNDKGAVFACGDERYTINMTQMKKEAKDEDVADVACGGFGNKTGDDFPCGSKDCMNACEWYTSFATKWEKVYLKRAGIMDEDDNIVKCYALEEAINCFNDKDCDQINSLPTPNTYGRISRVARLLIPEFKFKNCNRIAEECKVKGSHFRMGGVPPSQAGLDALSKLNDWQCCVMNNLIEEYEVIKRVFINSWIVGASYFFKFKYKERNNGKQKFCGPGADNRASDRYRLQACCFGDSTCDECLVRGPNTSREVGSQIPNYHINWHNDASDNKKIGASSNELDGLIYCNTMYPTKIVNLGSIEMCEDALSEINICLKDPDCEMGVYDKKPNALTSGSNQTHGEGWDPIVWSTLMDGSSYQSPNEVQEYLLKFGDACLRPISLFRNAQAEQIAGYFTAGLTTIFSALKKKCRELEFKYNKEGTDVYPQAYYQQISKFNNEIVLTTEESPCFYGDGVGTNNRNSNTCLTGDFRPGQPTEYTDFNETATSNRGTGVEEVSGFIFDGGVGQRFYPCGGGAAGSSSDGCNEPTYVINGNNLLFNSWVGTDWVSGTDSDNQDHSDDYVNNKRNFPYFYFGLVKSKTAIDKLKSKFFVKK